MLFGKRNLTSLVKCVSRFVVLLPDADRRTMPIMAKLAEVLGSLPFRARGSTTAGGGFEFVDWPHLRASAGVQTWFCDPRSSWQKGTVENANRRMRRWLPRDTDPTCWTSWSPLATTALPWIGRTKLKAPILSSLLPPARPQP